MPNKYSHALVLSHYQRRGLIDVEQAGNPKTSIRIPRLTSNPPKAVAEGSSSARANRQSNPSGRVRLRSPSPPAQAPETQPPQLHRRGSSTETQIYAPEQPLPQSPAPAEQPVGSIEGLDSGDHAQTRGCPSMGKNEGGENIHDCFDLYNGVAPMQTFEQSHDFELGPLRGGSRTRLLPLPEGNRMGCQGNRSFETEDVLEKSPTSRPRKQNPHGNGWIEEYAFVPQCPPSPPATPEADHIFPIRVAPGCDTKQPHGSPLNAERADPDDVFGNATHHDPGKSLILRLEPEPQEAKMSPVMETPTYSTKMQEPPNSCSPLPLTHSRPCSHSSSLSQTFSITTSASASSTSSHAAPQNDLKTSPRSHYRTFLVTHSPPFAANTRKFSLDATTSTQDFSELTTMPSDFFIEDDDDLESLPEIINSDALPWTDLQIGPAVFRQPQPAVLGPASPISTRAPSFDSVAPPPIRLHVPDEPTFNGIPTPESKNPRKSLSSFLFSRNHPKAVLYSQTIPGKQPVPVSVSRTAVPSIPSLFPNFKGSFPPEERGVIDHGSLGRSDSKTLPRGRGRSVPPKSPAEKRRSWFKS
ncbi:hypothetical protein MMC21_007294 [Puttea exsequens]|nr:hypothetical protein [Puttea exsequens]